MLGQGESMKKHTPGPWKVDKVDNAHCYIIAKNGTLLAKVWLEDNDFNNANAHLVAAAPDMLEALEAALSYWDQDRASQQIRLADVERILKSAIAKAKGES
jgi:hypothetical protein